MTLTKHCGGCDKTLPIDQFNIDRSKGENGRCHRCKTCKRIYQQDYLGKRGRALNFKRYWTNRDAERERHLVKKYGITFADYTRMLEAQGGGCGICKRPAPEHRFLDVDHDHLSGKVRGLLCTSCNRMLGHSGDAPGTLRAAADYLEKSS